MKKKKISKAFSNYFNSYTKSINKGYNRTGSLFQERFGRKHISDEKYFAEVIFYIHTNSQKHEIIDDFTNYPHSSFLSLLSDKPTLLQRKEVMEWFGNKKEFINFHKENMEIKIEYLKELERMNF